MAAFVRVLLWATVVVAPGGALLLPFLVADAVRRREGGAKPKLALASGLADTQKRSMGV